jgi:hypothetical protein
MLRFENNPQGVVANGLSDWVPGRTPNDPPRYPRNRGRRAAGYCAYTLALRPAGDCAGFV